jgi:hypothetical protein
VISRPSPSSRVIATPGMRCSDSDVLGEDRVGLGGHVFLDLQRLLQAVAVAGDDDFLQLRGRSRGITRGGIRGRLRVAAGRGVRRGGACVGGMSR